MRDGLGGPTAFNRNFRPASDRRQAVAEKQLPAQVALDFPAGGLGNASYLSQYHRADGQLVFLRDRAANGRHDFGKVGAAAVALQFANDDEILLMVAHAKRRTTECAHGRMSFLHRQLDILGIAIAAVENEQVFEPAGHEKLAIGHETKIARTKVIGLTMGTLCPGISKAGMEGRLALLVAPPIPLGNTWT